MSQLPTGVLIERLIAHDITAEQLALLRARVKRYPKVRKLLAHAFMMERMLRQWSAETTLKQCPRIGSKAVRELLTTRWLIKC